ncbi:hypothetical protein HME9302_01837 [Alteripontixanthobacter maritimus]|uniref:Heme oxygenase n=1 Tax=Alteripontixanthobacter maritimus TaxID=2161824 RepID=A0A369Q6Z0_9SPHN|nr:biliverdin-producing heme oxygenase [Alteripontixanthobacter maritimus]RDC60623.1 hypothetical protein HME9302_01837 [Alteripontixanthobacter maritimus]
MSRDTGRKQLRTILRRETIALHDRLDRAISRFDRTTVAGYARFLKIQYAARKGAEDWAGQMLPHALCPPPLASLISADLTQLGRSMPEAEHTAILAGIDTSSQSAALGAAWVLAGSSLGNRMMLRQVCDAAPQMPVAFLSDPAMPQFFARLRPLLEEDVRDPAPAIRSATAMFEHFVQVALADERLAA